MVFESNSRQDLYQYSGDGTQAGRDPAQPGPNPNLQREAVCRPHQGPGAQPGGRVSPCDWQADPTYSTPQAQQWRQQFEQLRPQPLQLNQDGTYTVVPGDCPSGIAERILHMRGQAATTQAINAEVQKMVAMNQDQYPTLNCNNARIKDGWNLRIDVQAPAPAPAQAPPDLQPQPQMEPRYHHHRVCPADGGQPQPYVPQPVPLQMGTIGDRRQPIAPVYQGDPTYVAPGVSYVEPSRRYTPDLGPAQPPYANIDIQQRYNATPEFLVDPNYHSHRRREFILRSHDDDYRRRFSNGIPNDTTVVPLVPPVAPLIPQNTRTQMVPPYRVTPPVAGTETVPPYRAAPPVVITESTQPYRVAPPAVQHQPTGILDANGRLVTNPNGHFNTTADGHIVNLNQGQPRVRETNVPTAAQLARQQYLQEQLARQAANTDHTVPRTVPATQTFQPDQVRRSTQPAAPGQALVSTDMPPLPPRPVQRPAAPPSAQANGDQQWRAQWGKVAPGFHATNDGPNFQNQVDVTQMKDPNRNGAATIDKKWVAPKVNLDGPVVKQTDDGNYKFSGS